MLRVWLNLMMAAALPWVCSSASAAEDVSTGKQLVDGNTTFAVNLYGKLAVKSGNLFFSPYSISEALGMTYAGARGGTAAEMQKALSYPVGSDELGPVFKKLDGELAAENNAGQKLQIANGLCLTGGDVSKEYKKLIQSEFGAELFKGDLGAINRWVSSKTEGKIPKLLDRLYANSVCVLLNAIYFKGKWESPFKKESTRDDSFKTGSGDTVKVPFMNQESRYQILNGEGFNAISLPYKDGSLSMVILLPDEANGMSKLEQEISASKLTSWLTALDSTAAQQVQLSMPKFTSETAYDLVEPCKALGMTDAFVTGKPDFSGMDGKKDLYISQIKHKAYVAVDEEGTEAAAATGVEMATRAILARPVVFHADHPFLYLIRDQKTGAILFLGRMVNPAAAE